MVTAFLGPFGTYQNDPFVRRFGVWLALLMGAYLLVRPLLILLTRIAAQTFLPPRALRFWGALIASVPVAVIWSSVGQDTLKDSNGSVLLVSFALLCGLAGYAVAEWSRGADRRFATRYASRADVAVHEMSLPPSLSPGATVHDQAPPKPTEPKLDQDGTSSPLHQRTDTEANDSAKGRTDLPLLARLSPTFSGPVIALQSEDHYVRVHGSVGSELLLMRLRDAIAEMGDVDGEQVHRSWWVAADGVVGLERSGRTYALRLAGGGSAPVARGSVPRLQRAGFLPGAPCVDGTS